jgi:hypothetical protein
MILGGFKVEANETVVVVEKSLFLLAIGCCLMFPVASLLLSQQLLLASCFLSGCRLQVAD